MESLSTSVLLLLVIVAFGNYRNGTLGDWLRAKFLNASAPTPASESSPFSSIPGTLTSTPAPAGSVTGGGLGTLLAPVSAVVTGIFGEPRTGHQHAGVDYGVAIGTPVKAAKAGRITYAGNMSGYGLLVQIDHGGGEVTRYGHLSQLEVSVGQDVKAGQEIAKSGNTGDSTGPHLHFEVRENGTAVDPSQFLSTPASVGAALTRKSS